VKIREVKLHALPDIPLSQPIACAWSPGKPYTFISSSFVEIQTDEGITGYGPPIDEGLLRMSIAPLLIGQDPFAVERNIKILRRAGRGWGLEVALWDIIGKACGQPLYKLWEATPTGSEPTPAPWKCGSPSSGRKMRCVSTKRAGVH